MATYQPFVFDARDAVRENVPILIGLTGPSGGGKTFSALRLALGIQEVVGGDIYLVDTENRRAAHYAGMKTASGKKIAFKHVPFPAPYTSLKYRDALRYCAAQGAGVTIIDSLSHEHEGDGGLLDFHEHELDRLAGDDWGKRERINMLAWAKPKADRRALLLEVQKTTSNLIMCFRAKETAKPVKVGNKTEVVPQGFVPIAAPELVFETTISALFLPRSGGVATWDSDNVGERQAIKLPEQFKELAARTAPFDEDLGVRLAKWARGGAPAKVDSTAGHAETSGNSGDAQRASNRDQASTEGRPCQADGAQANPPLDTKDTGKPTPGEGGPEESGGPARPEARHEGKAPEPSGDAATSEEPAAEPAAAGDGAEATQSAQDGPEGPAATGEPETSQGPSADAAEPAAGAFEAYAQAVAAASDWTQAILPALRALTVSEEWKATEPARQAMARRIAFVRLKELNAAGLKFDFLNDPHAFRCYLEFEEDADAILGNHRAFKSGALYKALPDQAKLGIDRAAESREKMLRSAPNGAEFA